jgi:hypothetical protein
MHDRRGTIGVEAPPALPGGAARHARGLVHADDPLAG